MRAFSRRERKYMQICQRRILDELACLLEILLGFSRESHQDVSAEPDVRQLILNMSQQFPKSSGGVWPSHATQNPVAAALHRDVEMAREDGIRGCKTDDSAVKTHRLDAAQANPAETGDFDYPAEKAD